MMNFCKSKSLWAAVLAAVFLASGISYAAEKDLTLEDIAKTDAAQFFVKKKFQDSLDAFLLLEKQNPDNVLIKRYLASLYDSIQRRDLAIQKTKEALLINPKDLISRQMLGDLYVKEGNLSESEKEFKRLIEIAGEESPSRKYAKRRIENIENLRLAPKTVSGKQLSAQDFMKSASAQDFAAGNFEKALRGFNALIQEYPQDVLLKRFKGIALTRMNRVDEAIAVFEEALLQAPDNAALHYYLGEAYAQTEQKELARREFQWLIKNDEGAYKIRAQSAIFTTLGGKPKASKKWTLTVNNGYEYDTNAIYKSHDDRFSQAGDQNSSRFNTNFIGTHRFYQNKNWFLTADGLYAQSLYTDFPNIQTYTSGAGLSAFRIFNFFGKPSYFNVRDGVTHTILKNKFFVFSNTFSPTVIVNLNDRIRTSYGYRFVVNQYESRGSSPDITDRSGITNGFSVSGTYYLDQAKKKYVTLGYDFDYDHVRGLNYKKYGNTGRMEIHWDLPAKFEFNFAFRYRDSYYPKYASGPPGRWDHQFTLTPSISRPLFWDWLLLTCSYTYETTPARNNAYEYFKHTFAVQTSARF